MGADFLKVDDDDLERLLREKGYQPTYCLPCVDGKNVYLHQSDGGINLEIKKYNSFFTKVKKFLDQFWA